MKNKKLFYTLGSVIVLVCLILIGCLSAITGEIPFFAPNTHNNSADSNDGTDQSGSGGNYVDIGANGSALDAHQVQYTVETDFEGPVFFHTYSYGNYIKSGWNNHQEPFYSAYNEISPLYFTSDALKYSTSYDEYTLKVTKYNPSDLNLIPYYLKDGPSNNNDFVVDYNFGKEYELKYYPYNIIDETNIRLNPIYNDVEARYYKYCTDNYLRVPRSVSEPLTTFMDDNGINNLDRDVINTVKNFLKEYKVNVKKNLSRINDDDIINDFLEGNTIPDSIHYASVATMMYRILGIPARIAGGYVNNFIPNTPTLIDNTNHICYAEIYRKNIGWTPIDVTPDLKTMYQLEDFEDLQDHSSIYKIKPYDVHKEYNGEIVKPEQNKIQGLANFLNKNYTITAKISGSRKDYGISYSYIQEFHLYTPSGKEVTNNYKFAFEVGIIQVYYKEICIETNFDSKIYDGKNIVSSGSKITNKEVLEVMEENNHRINKWIYQEPFSNVDRKLNSVELEILDYDDNDITEYYYINGYFNIIEILPKKLVVTTHDANKKFDGDALVNKEYDYNGLISDVDELFVVINGRQESIGYSYNTISLITITDKKTNENKIKNYDISYNIGKLTITA